MYYGHPPHTPSPEDLTILSCSTCGWHSPELTQEQLSARGIPWYCDSCGGKAPHFITFHPRERAEAYSAIGLWPVED